MKFNNTVYVPCLRWKLAEYQAVLRLSPEAKDKIVPLIEIPERGYDFEKRANSKSLEEHLSPFVNRISNKWGKKACFVDFGLVDEDINDSGELHLFDRVFSELSETGILAVPVVSLESSNYFRKSLEQFLNDGRLEICIRVKIEEAIRPDLTARIKEVLPEQASASNCHLILDIGTPNFEPLEGFSKAIAMIVNKIPYMNRWLSFTILGTSFPDTMAKVQSGVEFIPRFEWSLYEKVAESLRSSGLRIPSFGDYCVNNPAVIKKDMRLLKPSATIRYCTETGWLIVKGSNVRDNGYGQYRYHCDLVVNSSKYAGRSFSAGDEYIEDCAYGAASTGNLSTWLWVGTNRHIELVVKQISNLFAI